MNSPFGIVGMVAEKTGWTYHYITTGVSWIIIRTMLADSPKFITTPPPADDYDLPLATDDELI